MHGKVKVSSDMKRWWIVNASAVFINSYIHFRPNFFSSYDVWPSEQNVDKLHVLFIWAVAVINDDFDYEYGLIWNYYSKVDGFAGYKPAHVTEYGLMIIRRMCTEN